MMKIQKSFDDDNGIVYVVPTPIGNLEDITYRALKILETVSVIAAEDTRNTRRLLSHFEIRTPLISYHEHSKEAREQQLLDRLTQGESIVMVSDAGMPAISDHVYELNQEAIKADRSAVVLPRAHAALCALVRSRLTTTEFLFYGFLARKKKAKYAQLQRLKNLQATLLFYESPHPLKATLMGLHDQLGDRPVAIGRELTKRFEEYIRGTVSELIQWAETSELKGEFCIVVEGAIELSEEMDPFWWSYLSVPDHVTYYLEDKEYSSKDAIKQVAEDRHMVRRDVYQAYHVK